MKIKLITTILILGLISLTSAYYAGETIVIPLDYEIVNCSISGNSYNLNGLNLSWYKNNITISTDPLYKPDKFIINCFVIKGKEIVEQHYSSGSGSSRKKEVKLNYTDDINDLRKEMLLKQLMEGQDKEIENETIEDIDYDDEIEEEFNWIMLIIILIVFILFVIIILIINKRISKK